jgi:outer membrane lipoprotein-sorting protein
MRPRHIGRLLAASFALATLLGATPGPATPREIMERVAQTRKLEGSEAVVHMRIVSEKGEVRERKLALATRLYDDGKTEKRIYRFSSPPDVAGTGVLVFDYESAPDDIWVYLPGLRKTRRILSSQRSQSFMGSEFTYADLNIPAIDDFDYRLVSTEAVGADTCWVIDVSPKVDATREAEGYSKKTYWIDQEKFTLRKAVFYDRQGRLLKELTSDAIELVDPKNKRYRAMRMEISNKQNGRRSIFESKEFAFSPNAKHEYFTPGYLERP